MGTGKNEPGEHDNFSYRIDPNDYLPDFCAGKYADKAEGFICKIIYKYYSNRVTTTQAKYYKKGADGWTEEPLIPYDADKKLPLEEQDYDAMGIELASRELMTHLFPMSRLMLICRYSCRTNIPMLPRKV